MTNTIKHVLIGHRVGFFIHLQCFSQRFQTRVHLVSKNRHVIRPDASVWWIDVWKLSTDLDTRWVIYGVIGPSTSN